MPASLIFTIRSYIKSMYARLIALVLELVIVPPSVIFERATLRLELLRNDFPENPALAGRV